MHRASSHPILPPCCITAITPNQDQFLRSSDRSFSVLRVKYIVYYPSMGICCEISATNELLENLMAPSMNRVPSYIDLLQIIGGFSSWILFWCILGSIEKPVYLAKSENNKNLGLYRSGSGMLLDYIYPVQAIWIESIKSHLGCYSND